LNAQAVNPGLKKQQHAQSAAFQCLHMGEVEQDKPRAPLRRYCIAQLECGIAANNSSLAVNDRNLPYLLDLQVEHGVLLRCSPDSDGLF
jgi:hypothetical protein